MLHRVAPHPTEGRRRRLPTITTRCCRRRCAAESVTRTCPWRAEASSLGGGPPRPIDEAMDCTAPHLRPRVGATTRPQSTTVACAGPDANRLLATTKGLSMGPKRNDCHAPYLEAESRLTAAWLYASAHPGRPRPQRALLHLFRPLMSADCFPEVRLGLWSGNFVVT